MSEKPRNPLELIRHYIDSYAQLLAEMESEDLSGRRDALQGKLNLLTTLEADMETEYFPLGDRTTIADLRPGAVFATEDGIYALKSAKTDYHGGMGSVSHCILLASGEPAFFQSGDQTVVYEVIQPRSREE